MTKVMPTSAPNHHNRGRRTATVKKLANEVQATMKSVAGRSERENLIPLRGFPLHSKRSPGRSSFSSRCAASRASSMRLSSGISAGYATLCSNSRSNERRPRHNRDLSNSLPRRLGEGYARVRRFRGLSNRGQLRATKFLPHGLRPDTASGEVKRRSRSEKSSRRPRSGCWI
jgi:hypothetical protein